MLQDDLFSNDKETYNLAEGQLTIVRGFFSRDKATGLFADLHQNLNWYQDQITIHGKTMPIPRLNAWYADNSKNYKYSGIQLAVNQWTPTLNFIKATIHERFNIQFNSCLANLYRNGKDSVAWHSDDEPELGKNPTIFSVSLGEERKFHLRNKHDHQDKLLINLPHNSLLMMSGNLQHLYEHQIPKEANKTLPRVNLTFRNVY